MEDFCICYFYAKIVCHAIAYTEFIYNAKFILLGNVLDERKVIKLVSWLLLQSRLSNN